MKIKMDLSTQSIDAAIKQIELYKQKLVNEVIPDFLYNCIYTVMMYADNNILYLTIGDNVKSEIMNAWSIDRPETNHYSLINKGRGYMLEFGVGVVGKGTFSSPYATSKGYEYNILPGYKLSDGKSWIFHIDDVDDIDIQVKYRLSSLQEHPNSVKTQGQPATMFFTNAIMQFLANKDYLDLWDDSKARILK